MRIEPKCLAVLTHNLRLRLMKAECGNTPIDEWLPEFFLFQASVSVNTILKRGGLFRSKVGRWKWRGSVAFDNGVRMAFQRVLVH